SELKLLAAEADERRQLVHVQRLFESVLEMIDRALQFAVVPLRKARTTHRAFHLLVAKRVEDDAHQLQRLGGEVGPPKRVPEWAFQDLQRRQRGSARQENVVIRQLPAAQDEILDRYRQVLRFESRDLEELGSLHEHADPLQGDARRTNGLEFRAGRQPIDR